MGVARLYGGDKRIFNVSEQLPHPIFPQFRFLHLESVHHEPLACLLLDKGTFVKQKPSLKGAQRLYEHTLWLAIGGDDMASAFAYVDDLLSHLQDLCVMMSSTIRSVSFMPLAPMRVRLRMQRSTSSSIKPSALVAWRFWIASIAESTAVDTPLVTFSAQAGFAPSHTMPARLAIIFFTE